MSTVFPQPGLTPQIGRATVTGNGNGLRWTLMAVGLLLASGLSHLTAATLTGNVGVEYRAYQHAPLLESQGRNNASVSTLVEYFRDWDGGKQNLTVTPFLRQDQHDSSRSHADLRELYWSKTAADWVLRVGIRRVFWGVTESQHLVDIINQSDAVENLDGEDKLGQPMLNIGLIRDWGTLDAFLLTGFRERSFGSPNGRLWPLPYPVTLDPDNARYESSKQNKRLDLALRWRRSIDIWDIGLSHFSGTGRDPGFEAKSMTESNVLVPRYDLIEQSGLDLQATVDDWLLKLELISRDSRAGRYTAMTTGVENTLIGIFESPVDLGLICEYQFDDRAATQVPFGNDIVLGTRLAMNDAASTDLLALLILDLDHRGQLFALEASRRLGDSWKLSLEAKFFSGIIATDPLYPLRQDDHLQAELAWFF